MSECERHCRYFMRFREQDGSWSQWYECDLIQYAGFRRDPEVQTKVEKR